MPHGDLGPMLRGGRGAEKEGCERWGGRKLHVRGAEEGLAMSESCSRSAQEAQKTQHSTRAAQYIHSSLQQHLELPCPSDGNHQLLQGVKQAGWVHRISCSPYPCYPVAASSDARQTSSRLPILCIPGDRRRKTATVRAQVYIATSSPAILHPPASLITRRARAFRPYVTRT
ncbi:hypothetical protein P171DRAFT_36502 [Karstenula rhodostoma CBS 690.94]|uniref:Uncharacterized protein n=1 Tax=Karstenula rhodostoma CBS 690.94 TaxID=1392251 RepID=A0A9P4PI44_9PLEO|nr:hypothetical protein P171DRAFT_36502 [Karstenula rhodostoma CBS 690.94]